MLAQALTTTSWAHNSTRIRTDLFVFSPFKPRYRSAGTSMEPPGLHEVARANFGRAFRVQTTKVDPHTLSVFLMSLVNM